MTPHPWTADELRTLTDVAVEGRLTPDQAARLERLVLTHPDARRFYAEYAHLNAALRWTAIPSGTAVPAALPRRRDRRGVLAALAALAAAVLVGWVVWPREPQPVATLTDAKACKWDGGTLPTEPGATLRAGRLRLAEGLAKLTFASGAEVTLEGPADIELVSPMRCVLHRGQLVASVPPGARGFVVDTPGSQVTDYGTEFGVTVHPEQQTADVQVFSGHVDVLHRPTGATRTLTAGAVSRFTPADIRPFNPNTDGPVGTPKPREAGTRQVQVSTAQGRGRDAFVMPIDIPPDRWSDTLLLVKNTVPKHHDWNRKAYMAFDLAGVTPTRIRSAELSLTFAPSGMGFATQVPDATFTVYGLTDETLDDWDETGMRWHDAPANRPGGTALDPNRVVRLGSFEIPQGEQSGTRTVDGAALADFLRHDTNKLTTLILVRDTCGTGSSDLVHGFTSRRHPTLPPPTLRLTVDAR